MCQVISWIQRKIYIPIVMHLFMNDLGMNFRFFFPIPIRLAHHPQFFVHIWNLIWKPVSQARHQICSAVYYQKNKMLRSHRTLSNFCWISRRQSSTLFNAPLSGHDLPRAGGIASFMRLPVQQVRCLRSWKRNSFPSFILFPCSGHGRAWRLLRWHSSRHRHIQSTWSEVWAAADSMRVCFAETV